jgi:hypothetical protein
MPEENPEQPSEGAGEHRAAAHPHHPPGHDPLIDRLVPDPGNPRVKRLTGFMMGRSQLEDHWRLYLSVNLDHYIDFKKEDTLDAHQFRPARVVVWLKAGARVSETKTSSVPVEFLQGEIRRGFLRGTSGLPRIFADSAGCPGSGCAHCSVACSNLPGGDTVGYTCGC